MKKQKIFIAIATALIANAASISQAQKLPNVQKESVWAPANIKVDGKANEWDGVFQAYNHATEVYYTLANDNDKLYLVVQATDRQIINKIIGGGITFTIQKTGKKNDKDGISITYPIFEKNNRPYVGQEMANKIQQAFSSGGASGAMAFVSGMNKSDAKKAEVTEGDSIMKVNNKRLIDNSKYIGITGIKSLDTLISVYNEDGIKTGELFNNKMVYTYELSVDLKKLGLSTTDAAKFAYHITLNGLPPVAFTTVTLTGSNGSAASNAMVEGMTAKMGDKINSQGGNTSAPTDFWGEYTLAKK